MNKDKDNNSPSSDIESLFEASKTTSLFSENKVLPFRIKGDENTVPTGIKENYKMENYTNENSDGEIINRLNLLENNIKNTNKIIAIIGSVIGLIITVFIFASNSQYTAIKDMNNSNLKEIKTEINAINQRLDYQEKLNSIQIERDVQNQIQKK